MATRRPLEKQDDHEMTVGFLLSDFNKTLWALSRPTIWSIQDQAYLLDSVYRWYPIGVIVLRHLDKGVLEVLDGNQRIASLMHALLPGEGVRVGFDLEQRRCRPTDGTEPMCPVLSRIWDSYECQDLRDELREYGRPYINIIEYVAERVSGYVLRACHVVCSPEESRDIYQRLNPLEATAAKEMDTADNTGKPRTR